MAAWFRKSLRVCVCPHFLYEVSQGLHGEMCVCVSLCRQIVNNKPSHTEITESLQSAPLSLSRHLTSSHLPLVFPPRHLYTPLSDRQDRSAAALLNNHPTFDPGVTPLSLLACGEAPVRAFSRPPRQQKTQIKAWEAKLSGCFAWIGALKTNIVQRAHTKSGAHLQSSPKCRN